MSTFVIVPGAWDRPIVMDPLIAPLEASGHSMVAVDLPCDDPNAGLEDYAAAARAALPADLTDVVLVGYSFGGFTASTIAAEHPDLPIVYLAAWVPRPGVSVLDLFAGGDPFAGGDEAAGLAAFGGLIVSAGPGSAPSTSTDTSRRSSPPSRRRSGPSSSGRSAHRGSRRSASRGTASCGPPVPATSSRPPTRWSLPTPNGRWPRR